MTLAELAARRLMDDAARSHKARQSAWTRSLAYKVYASPNTDVPAHVVRERSR